MKDEIIQIAIRQLRLGGYDYLHFGNIATELGITRANVHHHFKNKEGLAIEAVKQYIEHEKQTFNQLANKHLGDLPGFLSALEDHLILTVTANRPFIPCVGSQIVRDSVAPESLRQLALRRFREEVLEVERLVVAHVEGTSDDANRAQALTFKIVSAMHGIDMMAQISQDAEALPSMIKGALSSLID